MPRYQGKLSLLRAQIDQVEELTAHRLATQAADVGEEFPAAVAGGNLGTAAVY